MREAGSVKAGLAAVKARIEKAAERAGRESGSVRLIAVSKTCNAETVREALKAGHRLFGENRVQEAAAKWPPLRAGYPDTVLHMIGGLQSNKAEEAVQLFDVIETLDRPSLARALAAAMEKTGRRPALFVQVNTGEEPQKGGVLPKELDGLLALCRTLELPVSGLMCIPPADENPAPHFAFLKELARRHGFREVSMGMSGDFETAVQLGATFVRVGTAIFGERPAQK